MIDLLGFGIVLSLLPQYADDYGASPVMLALLVALGFVVRRFLPRIGELRFNVLGCALLLVGLLGVAVSTTQWQA